MPLDFSLVQTIAIWALPVLFAITVHEAAHGYAARALGDHTAESLGRLSLNPLRHIDPIGTVVLPVVLLALGGFLFGWAKPVPVAMHKLRHPRRDMALVAAAGPASNALMALGWALLLRVTMELEAETGWVIGLRLMAVAGIAINVMLLVLNLLPLPPLDGGRVLAGLLPAAGARLLDRIERYGLLILVAMLASGLLGKLLHGPLQLAEQLVYQSVNIDPAALY